jgi:hypothetical protein
MNAQRTLLWLAFSGAILAACGDGMLLLLGNGNLALSLSPFSSLVLIGSLAGVIGIALYSFGYQARAEQVRSRHPRAAAWLTFCSGSPLLFWRCPGRPGLLQQLTAAPVQPLDSHAGHPGSFLPPAA